MRLRWVQVAPLFVFAVACNSILGIGEHELAPNAGRSGKGGAKAVGSAGRAGSSSAGAGGANAGAAGIADASHGGGTAGSENIAGAAGAGDGTAVGTLNQPCSPVGAYACAGHAQKGLLVCSLGKWAPNGACLSGYNCDSAPGINAGSCGPILDPCSAAGTRYCNGTSVEQCGVDLVTASVVQNCSGATPACLGGICVACNPKATQCDAAGSNGVQTCNASGAWGSAVACTNKACLGGVCQGVCAPGQKQCDGSMLQTCSKAGQWEDQTTCSGTTPYCRAGVCAACPGTGGPSMVKLPLGYCIDSTEVTRAQYQAWLVTNPPTAGQISDCTWNTSLTPQANWTSPSTNSTYPVTHVDWCDAYAYCKAVGKRLCGKIGGGSSAFGDYTKATLSQWYAACTSNGTNSFPYGSTYVGAVCNGQDAGKGATVAVGAMTDCQSSVSGYSGVHDLSGNVWEWEDSCDGDGQSAPCRLRGGGYNFYGSSVSCAVDLTFGRDNNAGSVVGFRCCAP